MTTLKITTTDEIKFNVDERPDGTFVVIGETIPMLLCGTGDGAVITERVEAALLDFTTYIADAGPDKIVRYLSDRGVSIQVETTEGRKIRRESFTLPELAVGAL